MAFKHVFSKTHGFSFNCADTALCSRDSVVHRRHCFSSVSKGHMRII